MFDFVINYWAVLVSALAMIVLGALWYSPILFGNYWMKLMGYTHEHMKSHKKEAMRGYVVSFIFTLLTAYILAHFLQYTDASTVADGMKTAGWLWLGFVVPTSAGSFLWENKAFSLFIINIAHSLVGMLIMSAILVSWI